MIGLWCWLVGHDWRLSGGVGGNAGPHPHPPNAQWSCRRCGDRYHIEGINVRTAQAYRWSPEEAERTFEGAERVR